jgi:dTDP-4-amino-4,6-dideoxygalactose transaminase
MDVKIPLVDLKAQRETIRRELQDAMEEVLETTAFVGGPQIARFEEAFARFCEAPHAVACASGTAALHLALVALGIGPGDEVVVPSFTFTATAEMVRWCGARVRFADIDEATYCLSPETVRPALTERTRLVIAVHLYGQPADMDGLEALLAPRGIALLEDAAQAHGARYKGRRVGSLTPVATFSFYPGKNLGAYGDAGAVTTREAGMAERIRRLADHGRAEKYTHEEPGFNYRMDSLQAAVLLVKLRHLEDWNAARRHWASRYTEFLSGVEEVVPPAVAPEREHVFHLYVVRVPHRDAVLASLREAGVGAGVHYPLPLHLQPAYRDLGYGEGSLPVCERLAREVLSLPLYPELDEEKVRYVVEQLKRALQRAR